MYIPNDVSFTVGFFVTVLYGTVLNSPRAGLLITFIIAVAKEINDQDRYGHYEWVTTVAVMCGAAVAYMLLNIFAVL